ncbi:MAG: aspartate/glutamate racemase family protein [Pseudomonadota bacterium]
MPTHPYELVEDTRPRLGLVVLQADETVEDDFRRLFSPDEVCLHITRIPSGAALNPETIRDMEAALPAAAALMPEAVRFDAVGYGCTSGSTLIGAHRVRALVQAGCRTEAVTDPLTAAFAAFSSLNCTRVGIVSPYIASVSEALRRAFEAHGFEVPRVVSFGEEIEANVARIAPTSIRSAAESLVGGSALDGVFLSCTNLRTLGVLDDLQRALGLPVLSSNLALAWHLAEHSGAPLGISLSAPRHQW